MHQIYQSTYALDDDEAKSAEQDVMMLIPAENGQHVSTEVVVNVLFDMVTKLYIKIDNYNVIRLYRTQSLSMYD